MGTWVEGKRCGFGEWFNSKGDHYIGEWLDGLPSGQVWGDFGMQGLQVVLPLWVLCTADQCPLHA